MSNCLVLQGKNFIAIGADTASSILIDGKYRRIGTNAKKLYQFGNEIMFCSGRMELVELVTSNVVVNDNRIAVNDLVTFVKSLDIQKSDTFDLEILICGVENSKSYMHQISQYNDFEVKTTINETNGCAVYSTGFNAKIMLDVAKKNYPLCQNVSDLFVKSFTDISSEEVGGYINMYLIQENMITKCIDNHKVDDIKPISINKSDVHYVIADCLIGDLIFGKTLHINNGKDTLTMDENGLTITNGVNTIIFDPNNTELMNVTNNDKKIFYLNELGDLFIDGNIFGGSLHLENDLGTYVDIDPNKDNIMEIGAITTQAGTEDDYSSFLFVKQDDIVDLPTSYYSDLDTIYIQKKNEIYYLDANTQSLYKIDISKKNASAELLFEDDDNSYNLCKIIDSIGYSDDEFFLCSYLRDGLCTLYKYTISSNKLEIINDNLSFVLDFIINNIGYYNDGYGVLKYCNIYSEDSYISYVDLGLNIQALLYNGKIFKTKNEHFVFFEVYTYTSFYYIFQLNFDDDGIITVTSDLYKKLDGNPIFIFQNIEYIDIFLKSQSSTNKIYFLTISSLNDMISKEYNGSFSGIFLNNYGYKLNDLNVTYTDSNNYYNVLCVKNTSSYDPEQNKTIRTNTQEHYILLPNAITTKIFYVTKDGEAFYGGGINVNNKFIVDKEGNVSLPPGTKISWSDVEGTDDVATSDQVSDQVASMEQNIMTEIGDTYVKTNEIEANIANLGGWEISSSGFKSADFDKITNTNGIRLDSNGEIRSKGSWYSSVDGSGVEGWFARLYSGKWIFGYYDSTQSDPFIPPADTPYSDISVNGIYMCSKDTILNKSSQYLFAVDTTRDVVSITSSSSNPALTITNNSEGTCLEIKNNSCTYDNKALSLGVTVVNTDDEGNTSSGMGYITVFGEGESNASRIIMRPDQNIKSTDTTNPANYTNSACGTYYYPWGTMSCVQLYADKTSTTSDAKLKTPINLIDSDTALEFINGLTPREYYFNDSKNKRHHMGFYAQEVSQLAKELNLGDMAIYEAITSKDNDETEYYYDENVDDEHLHWSLNYNEFIAPLVSAVQGLTKKIENLEAENEKLRTRIEKLEDVGE